ncbi:hypothetical protein ACHAWF_003977 [Thalassiosira exigua]
MGHGFDDLQRSMNKGCLEWGFTTLSKSVEFLDLTMSIDNEGGLRTTLFEKKMALYLFITPNMAHPPGITAENITDKVIRIHHLCSEEEDVTKRVCTFFRRLM